ncbi:hypothetical protein E2C01_078308 [Portunus trituberculatus]|uniref:Uncharacterized protein n=1 Tax=Portunus trituberculatus TaxID=210409 RepID=A0A5B7IPS5_PORTR|nr:hypothetical protein [Portunus trituberculatus]
MLKLIVNFTGGDNVTEHQYVRGSFIRQTLRLIKREASVLCRQPRWEGRRSSVWAPRHPRSFMCCFETIYPALPPTADSEINFNLTCCQLDSLERRILLLLPRGIRAARPGHQLLTTLTTTITTTLSLTQKYQASDRAVVAVSPE